MLSVCACKMIFATLSAGCPTAVSITITPDVMPLRPGHVLSCFADGYDPSYTWTGTVNAADIGSGGSRYTLVEGDFDLTCNPAVHELTCTMTAVSVSGTALGKCQIKHNYFVKY